MNRFFTELGTRLVAAAGGRGTVIEAPELDPVVAQELLELARVAAHTQERRFAPLATYLAGMAAARMLAAEPGLDQAALAEAIREVRLQLEADGTPD